MKQLSKKEVFRWMQDRTMQGVLHEEVGSCDSLDDADGFYWHANVYMINGKKCVCFCTSANMFSFAVGRMTKTGKPRIKWI